jgi:hypothetical protein
MELIDGGAAAVVVPLSAAVDYFLAEVAEGGFVRLSDADVLAEVRELESLRRRLAVADHALIAELDRRGLVGALAMSSTSTLLQGMLRLSPHEAKRRVDTALACGPRASLTGEVLEPLLPAVAAAQADGSVSPEHAQVIVKTLDQFPPELTVEQLATAEQILLEVARQLRPQEVAKAGARYLAYLRPDGVLASREEQDQVRELGVHARSDGTVDVKGRLTARCGAQLLAALTPRSAPKPADADGKDPRTYGQRMHDALEELAGVAVRRNELTNSGAPAQVIITMTEAQYRSRQGLVETSFGQLITVQQALELADEAALIGLVQAANGAVLKLGLTTRIANRAQTLALIGRDKGCSFPGCDAPPEWCQRHHVIPWWLGGPTDVDNLTLLCRYHHRVFDKKGWQCLMIDGMPYWIPPIWRDPQQKPQQNHRIRQGN